mmetsp:Transcript_28648/g.41818  ORF Transcript_28648/g.41818 Transcript_28648/m.41818 type:complete len:83 (-) Transcript_28648:258-506(-)
MSMHLPQLQKGLYQHQQLSAQQLSGALNSSSSSSPAAINLNTHLSLKAVFILQIINLLASTSTIGNAMSISSVFDAKVWCLH